MKNKTVNSQHAKCIHKTVLYEPVAPYFTNTYNTLISVVQGVILSYLFYMINAHFFLGNGQLDVAITCKFLLAFFMGCLLWHRYIIHDQYLAWRLGVFDSVIPMIFALIQVVLILSIPKSVFHFSLFTTIFFIWGAIAYLNTTYRHGRPEIEELYKEHFDCVGASFAEDLLWEIKKFEKKAIIVMICLAIFFGLFTTIMYYQPYFQVYDEEICMVIFTILCLPTIFFLFHYDLRFQLNHAEKLKDYKFRW